MIMDDVRNGKDSSSLDEGRSAFLYGKPRFLRDLVQFFDYRSNDVGFPLRLERVQGVGWMNAV